VPVKPPVAGLVRQREMVVATLAGVSGGVELLVHGDPPLAEPDRPVDVADAEHLLQIHDLEGELQVQLDDVVDRDRRRGHLAILGKKGQGFGLDHFLFEERNVAHGQPPSARSVATLL
jgi:hypothetical protein